MTVNQTDGNVLYGADVKAFGKLLELDTGTDLDFSVGASSSGSTNVESADLTATDLGNSQYVTIELRGLFRNSRRIDSGGSSTTSMKIEAKDVGGTYVEVFNKTASQMSYFGGSGLGVNTETGFRVHQNIKYTHTLTTDEKTNGVKFRITLTYSTGANSSADYTNTQILYYTGF